MNNIALKLIEFGMDFQYENFGSHGEKITCHQASFEITSNNGSIYYEYRGERNQFIDNEKGWNAVLGITHDVCVNETT